MSADTRLAAADDFVWVRVQNTFTNGTENVLVAAKQTGYTLRILKVIGSLRTVTLNAASTITFKRDTTAIAVIPTNDGREVYRPHEELGYGETSADTEDLNVNCSVAGTSCSLHVLVQRIPV